MTPQESQLLRDFLQQLNQARGTVKDPEAEALIAKSIADQPDAAYLLVQRNLLLEQALNNAKAQITQLQNQTSANQGSSSFLNGGWGKPQTPPAAPIAAPVPNTPAIAQPTANAGFLSGGAGSFLGNVAATAAGVAGGAFLFQGISSLLGHHGGGFLGQNTPNEKIVENTTVNNYYGDDQSKSSLASNDGDDGDDSLMNSSFDDNSTDDDLSSI